MTLGICEIGKLPYFWLLAKSTLSVQCGIYLVAPLMLGPTVGKVPAAYARLLMTHHHS